MSLGYDWYYRIEGKPELLVRLKELSSNNDIIALLCDPVLWKYSEHGLSRITLEFIEIQMKLLFIANLSYLYLSANNDSDIVQPLRMLLGTPPVKIDVFDQWWTIEHYLDFESADDVLDWVSASDLKLLAKTGNAQIDRWLQQKIERREASE